MNGIRVRIAVNSVYTPSVRVTAVAEKHLTRRRRAGRRAARKHPERRVIIGGGGLAIGRGTGWDSVAYFVGLKILRGSSYHHIGDLRNASGNL